MKKVHCKKTLVRNTVQPIQKCRTIPKEKVKADHKVELSNNLVDHYCKLDKPELQSTLKLVKTIDNITTHKRTERQTESEKLAVDEKITRKVNFPYDQHIYKDLIPLEADQCKSPLVISSRIPLPHKDKEPILSDFLDTKVMHKCYCYPHIKIENKMSTLMTNNLRLYHTIEKYDGLKQ